MQSAVREAAAQVVGYARRKRFASVTYDDSARAFCPDFPFAALRERLRTECDAAGVRFEYSNDAKTATTDDQLAFVIDVLAGHR
jgi:hypothetical protein